MSIATDKPDGSGVEIYTEGPSGEAWFFEGNAVMDENRLTVAIVVTEDDGNLIAAAPRMEAALRNARKWIGNCGLEDGPKEILAEIDAALAEAEGRS